MRSLVPGNYFCFFPFAVSYDDAIAIRCILTCNFFSVSKSFSPSSRLKFTLLVQTFEVGMILHSFLKVILELNRNEKEMIKTALSIYF